MIKLSVNCSRVSVRRLSHVLQKLQGCASHPPSRSFGVASSETATVPGRRRERIG